MAIFVGLVFTAKGSWLLLHHDATIDVNGVPATDISIKAIVLMAGLVISVLGILMLKARRYRPDLGDHAFSIFGGRSGTTNGSKPDTSHR
jgi:hypothetical protein